MKQVLRSILIILTLITSNRLFAQVQGKFGTNQGTLDVNAALEIESTSKGVLLPRLTTAQQNAMSAPTDGLLIYNVDSACFVLRRAGIWRSLCAANAGEAWSTLGNAGTNANTYFLGTTDAQALTFKTNGTEWMRILSTGNVGIGTSTPSATLDVAGNAYIQTTANATPLAIAHYGTNNTGGIRFNKYQGTKAAPESVKDNWNLGTIDFWGSDASGSLRSGAAIVAVASQDFTNTGSGTNLDFRVTPIGSTTVVNQMRLTNDGKLGINTTAPSYRLDIDAETGSSGNPLRLRGLLAGASTDSVLTAASGVVRRRSVAEVLSNAWNITGNSNTAAGTNFIGTTNAQGLAFRTNNTEWMRLNTIGNLGIGIATPTANLHLHGAGTSGYAPVAAIGVSSGPEVAFSKGGFSKPAATIQMIDYDSYSSGLAFNVHKGVANGGGGVFADNWPTDVIQAMTIDNQGRVGIGTAAPNQQLEIAQSFRFPQTTSSSIGVIYKGANRFMHDYKPSANDGNNTFLGVNAGNFTMSSGTSWLASSNTGIGANALTAITAGGFNTAMGTNAMTANTTGSYNLGVGSYALAANTIGVGNTAVGHNTLATATANNNTAIGNAALYSTTTGSSNTGIGDSNLNKNTTGNQNTAVGQASMRENLTGSNNTAMGLSALQANTTGNLNVAVGVSALVDNVAGNNNTAVGYDALASTTSSNNVGFGYFAGVGNTTGTSNTFVGYNTGATNTTGSNNTLLGYQANVTSAALTNATAIGNGATVNASNKIRLGNSSVTLVETQGSFVTVSDRRLKTHISNNDIGLNFIKAVRPVNYELKAQKGIVYDGFIAQEIDSIMQKLNIKTFSGLSKPADTEGGYYTVSYATFVVPLVNAVKELDDLSDKLKVKSDKLEAENAALKAELERMKKDNDALKASVDKNSQDIEMIKAALVKKQN